jgi:hypothetical protein
MQYIGLTPGWAVAPDSCCGGRLADKNPSLQQPSGEISEVPADSPPLLAAMDLGVETDMKRTHGCHAARVREGEQPQ